MFNNKNSILALFAFSLVVIVLGIGIPMVLAALVPLQGQNNNPPVVQYMQGASLTTYGAGFFGGWPTNVTNSAGFDKIKLNIGNGAGDDAEVCLNGVCSTTLGSGGGESLWQRAASPAEYIWYGTDENNSVKISDSGDQIAVNNFLIDNDGYGVKARSNADSGAGIYGYNNYSGGIGVYGANQNSAGYGVFGYSKTPDPGGVWGWAGYFLGDVSISRSDATLARLCLNGTCVTTLPTQPDPSVLCLNGDLDQGEQCTCRSTVSNCYEGSTDVNHNGFAGAASCTGLGYNGGILGCTNCVYNTAYNSPTIQCNLTGAKKYVFITGGTVSNSSMNNGVTPGRISITVDGIDYVGRLAANKICMSLAENSTAIPVGAKPSSGAEYRAWVSGSEGGSLYSPATTWQHTGIGYYLPDSGYSQVQIASSWTNLVSGTILNKINRTENGSTVADGVRVWTGTGSDGNGNVNVAAYACLSWTSTLGNPSANGVYGSTTYVNWGWTGASVGFSSKQQDGTCASNNRLYCFQQ